MARNRNYDRGYSPPAKKLHVQKFELDEADLVQEAEDSDYDQTNIIISICQQWRDKGYISEKQRWALAFFVAYGPRDDHDREPIKSIDDEDIPF